MGRRYQTEIRNDRGRQREYQGAYETDYNQHGTYIDGNTVRRYEAAPKPPPEKDPRQEQEERKARERKRLAKQAAKASQQRAMRMSPGYILFLSAAMVLTVAVCAVLLKMQADSRNHMDQIAALENQILELKTKNDAARNKIERSINLKQVRDIAINQMGMRYPTQDQIIYFEVDEDDYMNQYQDIPQG